MRLALVLAVGTASSQSRTSTPNRWLPGVPRFQRSARAYAWEYWHEAGQICGKASTCWSEHSRPRPKRQSGSAVAASIALSPRHTLRLRSQNTIVARQSGFEIAQPATRVHDADDVNQVMAFESSEARADPASAVREDEVLIGLIGGIYEAALDPTRNGLAFSTPAPISSTPARTVSSTTDCNRGMGAMRRVPCWKNRPTAWLRARPCEACANSVRRYAPYRPCMPPETRRTIVRLQHPCRAAGLQGGHGMPPVRPISSPGSTTSRHRIAHSPGHRRNRRNAGRMKRARSIPHAAGGIGLRARPGVRRMRD